MLEVFLTQKQLISSIKSLVPVLRDRNSKYDNEKLRFVEYVFSNYSLHITDGFDINLIYSEIDSSWTVRSYDTNDKAYNKVNDWLNDSSIHKSDTANELNNMPFNYHLPENVCDLQSSYIYNLFNRPFGAQLLTNNSVLDSSGDKIIKCQTTGHYLLYDPYFIENIIPKQEWQPSSLTTLKSLIKLAEGPIKNICIISEKKYKKNTWEEDVEKNLDARKWKMVNAAFPNMVSILELDLRNMDDDYHDRDLFMDLCHIEIGSGFGSLIMGNKSNIAPMFKIKKATKIYYKSIVDKEYYKFSIKVYEHLLKLVNGSNYVQNYYSLDQVLIDASNNFSENIYLKGKIKKVKY